jgi:aquaporin NIP
MQASNEHVLKKVGAEMVGTFALVFAGCGAIMVDTMTGGTISHVGIGLVFGLVITVMIYATGHISGAHFNPAVTLAFASVGRFPWRQVPAYIIGQSAAALLASAMLYLLLGPVAHMGATMPSGSATQSLVLEAILTFFLMFVITAVATDGRAVGEMAGLAIGGTVALAAIFAGPICGASMNPARSLAPALVDGNLSHLWIYIVGPIAGALLGAWTYRLVRCTDENQSAADGCC